MYAVTKKHIKGFFKGMKTKELTEVKFKEGKNYGNYICIFCKEITDNDCIVVIGSRFGIKKASASGTIKYAKETVKYYRSIGYDTYMYLQQN